MSNAATKSDTSVNVITDAQAEELQNYMRSLHGKMLTILQGVGIKPTFNDKFADCTNEDYKNLHQQSRVLLSAKAKAKWESYIGDIASKVQGVIDTHMEAARGRKAKYLAMCENTPDDMKAFIAPFPTTFKVPVSALVGCWPQGTPESQVVVELDKLFPKNVGKGKDDVMALTVTYKDAEVAEAPKSAPQVKAA